MPKRTNDFQDLVSLIQKALAPNGATVTDSALVGEDAREIDVLIDGKFGLFRMRIAVEAKDEKRKMDLTKFESILGKYLTDGGIKVNKIVVVTHQGFTGRVIKRAKLLGIELLTLKQAESKSWSNEVQDQRKLMFRVQPHVCRVTLHPEIVGKDDLSVFRQGTLYCPSGGNHGSPVLYATKLVFEHWLPKNLEVFKQFERRVDEEHGGCGHINMGFPLKGWKLLHKDKMHKVESIDVQVHLQSGSGEITAARYEQDSTEGEKRFLNHIQCQAGGAQISLLMPETSHGHPAPKIMLKIESLDPSTKKGREKRKRLLDKKRGPLKD